MPAGAIERFDTALLGTFAAARTPVLDTVFAGVTWLGSLWLLLPLALLAGRGLARRDGPMRGAVPAIALLASSGICHAVKFAADRNRPDLHQALVALPVDAAFPSAHAAQAMALALTLALLLPLRRRPGWGTTLIMLALAVGISRLYLQVHWPSDVVAGWVLGSACALVALRLTPATAR
jgi:undecaprenyl-diphosphatase